MRHTEGVRFKAICFKADMAPTLATGSSCCFLKFRQVEVETNGSPFGVTANSAFDSSRSKEPWLDVFDFPLPVFLNF